MNTHAPLIAKVHAHVGAVEMDIRTGGEYIGFVQTHVRLSPRRALVWSQVLAIVAGNAEAVFGALDVAYVEAVCEAIDAGDLTIGRWLTPECVECDEEPGKPDGVHYVHAGYVVIGCRGLNTVDPNAVGIEAPHWRDWQPATATLITAVRDHATAHRDEPGWADVADWSDQRILTVLLDDAGNGPDTEAEAVTFFGEFASARAAAHAARLPEEGTG